MAPRADTRQPLCVLLVEDSAEVRRALRAQVEEIPNVRVIGTAGDAETAIEFIRSLRPDVVLLDLRLSRSSGLTVLVAAQVLVTPPRIVVLTNDSEPRIREHCLALGALECLDKATEFDRALALLRRWSADLLAPTLRGPPE